METSFELPVHYKGQDIELPMRLVSFGYTYRFVVQAGEAEIVIEKDEQGELRALIDPEQVHVRQVDAALIEAIMNSIQQII